MSEKPRLALKMFLFQILTNVFNLSIGKKKRKRCFILKKEKKNININKQTKNKRFWSSGSAIFNKLKTV